MRTLLRAIYYAVVVGVGIDAFFFGWLLGEDRFGLSRGQALPAAAAASALVTAGTWAAARLVRLVWIDGSAVPRARPPGRHPVEAAEQQPTATTVVASSPLASPSARRRAGGAARLDTALMATVPPPRAATKIEYVLGTEDAQDPPIHDGYVQNIQQGGAGPTTAGIAAVDHLGNPAPRSDLDTLGRALPLGDSLAASRHNVAAATELYGADDARTLRARAVLACAYWAVGDLTRAVPLYEATVADAIRVLGPDHVETLTWRGDLAAAYELDGRLDEAIELYEVALAGRERAVGANDPQTKLLRTNLAVATTVRSNLTRGRASG